MFNKFSWIVIAIVGLGITGLLHNHQAEPTRYMTITVTRQDVLATVNAVGTLRPRQYVDVGAQVSGQIQRIHVTPGSKVEQGQLLVAIDPSVQQSTVDARRAELAGLRAQLADQQAQHILTKQQLDRQKILIKTHHTRLEALQIAEANRASSSARIEQLRAQINQAQAELKADETRLSYTRIYAPISGTVVSVTARDGQTLNANYQTPNMLRIADLTGMTVWTQVSEADIRRIATGMPVQFTTLGEISQPQPRQWISEVRQVMPAPLAGEGGNESADINVKAVMYTVLFDAENPDGELMPQMTAQVSFVAERAMDVLVVPLSALQQNAEGQYEVSVLIQNQAENRTVDVGVRSQHIAEITRGLAEGELVITGSEQQQPLWQKWVSW